jgi:hypothetical protein
MPRFSEKLGLVFSWLTYAIPEKAITRVSPGKPCLFHLMSVNVSEYCQRSKALKINTNFK